MSVPVKPWERPGISQPIDNLSSSGNEGRNVLSSNAPQISTHPMGSVRTTVPLPSLPPRPPQLSVPSVANRPAYGMSPAMYPGGYSGFNGYGGYSSYGGYGGGYGSHGYGGYGYGSYGQPAGAFGNRFLQAAEESSRNTFQSIESLVSAFSSVSMMLESTYHAMYSSFRAILGVVDNFSRLRQMFAQFLSAITILQIIKNFYRRLLYWIGVIDSHPVSERVWESVNATAPGSKFSAWPLVTFIGILFGGPYVISKFFSSTLTEPKKWDLKRGTFYRAVYPFEAGSERDLGFSDHELLNVAPAELQMQNNNGWLLATNQQGKVGYVPLTRLSAPLRQQDANQQTINNLSNGVDLNPAV